MASTDTGWTKESRDDLARTIAESDITDGLLENEDIDALVDLFEAWTERRKPASDAEQLSELRKEALKGICVYCGEIQQYESLEQKSGEEGNRIRVEHIKQCTQRPELKLIAYCEELQEAANAAFKCLCGTGDKTIEQVKDQIYKVLNPQPGKETR